MCSETKTTITVKSVCSDCLSKVMRHCHYKPTRIHTTNLLVYEKLQSNQWFRPKELPGKYLNI